MRMKDRFSPGRETGGGWRDAMFNAYFVDNDENKHIFEVQLHHKQLLLVRQKLGGHVIYAKYRALLEALEVAGCDIVALEKYLDTKKKKEENLDAISEENEDELKREQLARIMPREKNTRTAKLLMAFQKLRRTLNGRVLHGAIARWGKIHGSNNDGTN